MGRAELMSCQRRILEVTGRTIVVFLKAFFGVEKVNEKGECQKDEKEENVEILPLFFAH